MMSAGGNIGPRLFILGNGTPSDTGTANSIGMKFQMSDQLYFQAGSTTLSADFADPLPTNTWIFVAAVYDGTTVSFYEGTETDSVNLIASTSATQINLGTNATLLVGNRADRTRSFNGWIDDFRFYSGTGDINFVESVRQTALVAAGLNLQNIGGNLMLVWTNGTLQSATSFSGPWSDVTNATSPWPIVTTQPQQFYRLRF
jgi:hypothetical protein